MALSRASRPANAAAVTDVGRHRAHNEDAYLLRPDIGLYVVADGMGGHEAGDVASAMAAEAVTEFFRQAEQGSAGASGDPADDLLPPAAVRLVSAIRKANRDVHHASRTEARHRGMGSTIVALYLPRHEQQVAYVAHVGDSRCYRARGGAIEQITRDHSLINEALAIDPTLSPEDLALLPSNIITRALGLEPSVEVDLRTLEVRTGDVFLLCSDGLSGAVPDVEIAAALRLADDVDEASDLLVALANEAGGYDNITVLVVET